MWPAAAREPFASGSLPRHFVGLGLGLLLLGAAACPSRTTTSDGSAGGDLTVADLTTRDGTFCLSSTPPTKLYQNPCSEGLQGFCFYDHPPEGFF